MNLLEIDCEVIVQGSRPIMFYSFGYGLICRFCNALALILFCTMGQAETQSEAAAETPAKTVVAFGDSLTQGYGLPAESGFVPQLGAWLAGQGAQVRTINAGVSGDTTAGGLARLDWAPGSASRWRGARPRDSTASRSTHPWTAATTRRSQLPTLRRRSPGGRHRLVPEARGSIDKND